MAKPPREGGKKALSNLGHLWLRLHMDYKGPTEVKCHLSPRWGCPLYQKCSLLMAKFKSPSVEWMPPRDKRPLDNVFQPRTHRTQPYVTHLMGATTRGASFRGPISSCREDRTGHAVPLHGHVCPPSPAKDLLWESATGLAFAPLPKAGYLWAFQIH